MDTLKNKKKTTTNHQSYNSFSLKIMLTKSVNRRRHTRCQSIFKKVNMNPWYPLLVVQDDKYEAILRTRPQNSELRVVADMDG